MLSFLAVLLSDRCSSTGEDQRRDLLDVPESVHQFGSKLLCDWDFEEYSIAGAATETSSQIHHNHEFVQWPCYMHNLKEQTIYTRVSGRTLERPQLSALGDLRRQQTQ